jgi:hypothetical protein
MTPEDGDVVMSMCAQRMMQDGELAKNTVVATVMSNLGLERALKAKGGGIEAGERQAIVNKMDAISEDWVRLRLAVCSDFYKCKLITQDDYQRQVKCFDGRTRGHEDGRGHA